VISYVLRVPVNPGFMLQTEDKNRRSKQPPRKEKAKTAKAAGRQQHARSLIEFAGTKYYQNLGCYLLQPAHHWQLRLPAQPDGCCLLRKQAAVHDAFSAADDVAIATVWRSNLLLAGPQRVRVELAL